MSLIAERKIFMLEDGEWNASCAKALRKIDLAEGTTLIDILASHDPGKRRG